MDLDEHRPGRERGHVTAYEHNDRYTYVAADLTEGYANTKNFARVGRRTKSQKVEKVTRQMLYLRGEEELIVLFDRVLATKPEFPKTWVLNMMNEPETLLGGAPARASESTPGSVTFIGTADRFSTTSSQELKQQVLSKGLAKLACQTLLPKSPRITVRGGPGFTSWGNPHNPKAQFSHRDPSGEVSPVGNARRRSAGGLGCLDRWYRVEVEPAESSKYTEFLHLTRR